nr:hypothetical protein [uncultured Roseococcus sp.]
MIGKTAERQFRALISLHNSPERYLSLGELPRGIGCTIMETLTRGGYAEAGPSCRFPRQAGWKITTLGIHALNKALQPETASDPGEDRLSDWAVISQLQN